MADTEPSTRTKKLAAVALFLATLGVIVALVYCVTPWAASDFNKELGTSNLPEYRDENVTLSVWPVERGVLGEWGYEPTGEPYIASDRGAFIEIRDTSKFTALMICYVEVWISNGTPRADLKGWSAVIFSGNKSGQIASSPHQLVIPSNPALTSVTFQVRMNSTNWNTTFPTPTALNGMNFTYVVRYSVNEMAIDRAERLYTRSFALGSVPFLLALSVEMPFFPRTEDGEESDVFRVEKEVRYPEMWLKYMSDRIEGTDNARHNLILEEQVILLVLGSIASYVIQQGAPTILLQSIVLLAAPLVGVIIFLMFGPRTPKSSLFISDEPKDVLVALRREYLMKATFLARSKRAVSVGTFYMLAAVFSIALSPIQPVYHVVELSLAKLLFAGAIVFFLGLSFYLLYFKFARVRVEVIASTPDSAYIG